VPPYHPDYKEGEYVSEYQGADDEDDDSDEYIEPPQGRPSVRRGSEGYEIRPQSRDDMLRRYIEEIGEDPHRYVRYEPEPFSESEDEDEDNIPLARTPLASDKNV
jgi:palmitoyltransferase ZDHHC6